MIILIKLILAHLIGDFVLQPRSWVKEKEKKKAKSFKLYLHFLIHGLLILLVLWNLQYWFLALSVMLIHGLIDMAKLYFQKKNNKTSWFVIDQGLHLISIFIVWLIWTNKNLEISLWLESTSLWIYITALLFLTSVTGILIQVLLTKWSKSINEGENQSLDNAGKYIGILERLFVFTFVILGRWEAIGFLLAAKSVFRFGDLKESKDRKLTEYILIGTLLSFGIAIMIGIVVLGIS
ncbi:Protein of unknown function (DUF3307) [Belliella baltica DSM 15883]|uniref:DUF3307 domain-containing protein n=1 Tax=Belliella baltica (strain DSM 15883 / CIP 108006 / LMG 21964 / BA134) TaxID=866536 RepID=I3Z8I3_BELBD|nr:DUF3307 domain-containing protein [Belliella baltica]AFL85551.1 Protein of unknown function (DUF3307) [Belliella baltica DSM 15883]